MVLLYYHYSSRSRKAAWQHCKLTWSWDGVSMEQTKQSTIRPCWSVGCVSSENHEVPAAPPGSLLRNDRRFSAHLPGQVHRYHNINRHGIVACGREEGAHPPPQIRQRIPLRLPDRAPERLHLRRQPTGRFENKSRPPERRSCQSNGRTETGPPGKTLIFNTIFT